MAERQPVLADRASHRTVAMLRKREQRRLAELARAQKVSTGEIIRRAILAYDPAREAEESLAPLAELWRESSERAVAAVDRALAEVSAARTAIRSVLG